MSEKRVSVRYSAEGGNKVRAEFKGIGEDGTREFKRVEDQAAATGRVLTRVMAVLGAAVSVRELVRYADTWTDLRSRVDLATGSQEAGAAVMERLTEMARRTYSSLEQTTESYLANATALRELGMTTRQSLDFTEALNNAIVVSGARQERAAQISNALSQAMALGALRGQQLNTVIMNGGRVAELLAAEMGVGVNQLRELGAQGLITGDVIRRALVGNLELLREEADSMPATIGDAFILMGNAALTLVGQWDQLLQASSRVADGIIFLADNLERVAAYGIALAGFMAGRYVVAFVAARVATMSLTGALIALRGALIRTGIGALIVGAGELIFWFGRLVRAAGGFGAAMEVLGRVAAGVWEGIAMSAAALVPALQAIWNDIEAGFFTMLESMSAGFAKFMSNFTALAALPDWGVTQPFKLLGDAAVSVGKTVNGFTASANRAAGQADRLRAAAGQLANDGFRRAAYAAQELRAVVTAAGESGADALDAAAASAANYEAALGGGRGGGGGARGAAEAAGGASAAAAEQALEGWAAAAEAVRQYAEEAANWGKGIGDALTGAFTSAENAFADFVTTGKLDFRSLAQSILADLARIAARQYILGPIANALTGALGGLGGAPLNAMGSGPLASFDGGGWTGNSARTGGLDGRGGFLAVMHPQEQVIDRSGGRGRGMGGGGDTHVHMHGVRDFESFRQSRSQMAADIGRAVAFGQRTR